jgi:UDP-glucose 4-epimerase
MKKILVTGSNGYIGRHLCAVLDDSVGHEVTGLDRMDIKSYASKFIHQDILNMECLDEHYDAVVHLAALVNVGDSVKYPMRYFQTNVAGTLNVLERINYDHFIFASTGAASNVNSPYALSKKVSESMVREYCSLSNKDYTIFRFYNVIGSAGVGFEPTNQDGLMYNLMKARNTGEFNLHGNDYNTSDGTAVRDYLHVYEVCKAIRFAISRPSNLLVENLGTGEGHTVQQIIDTFKKVNNCDFKVNVKPRRPGDLEHSVLHDVSPYMQKQFTLEEMLKV